VLREKNERKVVSLAKKRTLLRHLSVKIEAIQKDYENFCVALILPTHRSGRNKYLPARPQVFEQVLRARTKI